MAISESDLKSRWEYRLRIKAKGLRIFNGADATANSKLLAGLFAEGVSIIGR
jgi:hypothetical protein